MRDAGGFRALLLASSDAGAPEPNDVIEALYEELHGLARRQLRRERPEHSLSPTALVHEAYLKLIEQRRVHWHSREHFFAIASRMMRRVLVDYARGRATAKRNRAANVALQEVDGRTAPTDVDILALDAALEKLGRIHPRQGRLVELRFFAGLTIEESAAALEVAPITVKRDWALARAWLFRELHRETP
jgi:RNA polymerase sigma factor (TIGR02999 family)